MVSANIFLQLATYYIIGIVDCTAKKKYFFYFALCQIITSQRDFDKKQVYLIIEKIVQATVGNNGTYIFSLEELLQRFLAKRFLPERFLLKRRFLPKRFLSKRFLLSSRMNKMFVQTIAII